MPGKTKAMKIAGREFVITRPTFVQYREIATIVEALLDVEFGAAMTTLEFRRVLIQLTGDNPRDFEDAEASTQPEHPVDQLDYADAASLWDAIIDYCEFEAFFASRRQQHYERSKKQLETQVDLQAAQYARMKKQGLLPESFSIENILTGNADTTLMSSLPSLTGTPAGTDGSEKTSSTKTTGSSQGTSRKPRAAGKRSSD